MELRTVFGSLRDRLETQGRSSLADTLISSSIFLRYLCPAILSPSLFNLVRSFSKCSSILLSKSAAKVRFLGDGISQWCDGEKSDADREDAPEFGKLYEIRRKGALHGVHEWLRWARVAPNEGFPATDIHRVIHFQYCCLYLSTAGCWVHRESKFFVRIPLNPTKLSFTQVQWIDVRPAWDKTLPCSSTAYRNHCVDQKRIQIALRCHLEECVAHSMEEWICVDPNCSKFFGRLIYSWLTWG